MLNSIFSRPRCRQRLANNPDLDSLERFARYLRARDFDVSFAQTYIRVAEHFGAWFRHAQRVPVTKAKNHDFDAFIQHLPQCRCPRPAPRTIIPVRAGLCHFKQALFRRKSEVKTSMNALERTIEEYYQNLKTVAGLAESTCIKQRFYAKRLSKKAGDGQFRQYSSMKS